MQEHSVSQKQYIHRAQRGASKYKVFFSMSFQHFLLTPAQASLKLFLCIRFRTFRFLHAHDQLASRGDCFSSPDALLRKARCSGVAASGRQSCRRQSDIGCPKRLRWERTAATARWSRVSVATEIHLEVRGTTTCG